MAKPDIRKLIESLEARKKEERGLLLAMLLIIIGYSWLVFVYDPLNVEQEQLDRQIISLVGQIAQEGNRYFDIQRSYGEDPNAFARNRQRELQQETIAVDARLNEIYGQLIQPRQMAEVLTTILQRETTLRLVNLENQPSSVLVSTTSGTAVPLVGNAVAGIGQDGSIQVYRHGLQMVFEGDYVETIRYLRSLENLETSFFWDSLSYEVQEWPVARITLNIFTLSTQEEWIGV